MILFRFQFNGWVGFDPASNTTDGYSFQKPIDEIMEAKHIESFIASHPHKTFKVTTLMDEETHRNKALDRFIQQEFKRPLVESSDRIPGVVSESVYKDFQNDSENNKG